MNASVESWIAYLVALVAVWIPVGGLIWLAIRRERESQARLLREATRHLQLVHTANGARNHKGRR